jgi:xanthine dehydrogenase YagR molybdenum-binding subunit
MADLKVAWKPREENTILGTSPERADGLEKAAGGAKYSADWNTPGTLQARLLTSPHAHARITSLDASAAKRVPGVRGVYVFPDRAPKADGALYEIKFEGDPLVAVAADTPAQAADGLRAVKIEYEVLPHFVDEFDLAAAYERGLAKPQRDAQDGDLAAALAAADTTHRGYYGIHTITHCCLEPHGSHCEWKGDELDVHLSTQNVSGTAGQFAGAPQIGIDVSKVTVTCDYIGGGFGSKFQADEWGVAAAVLAKEAGKPVRLMLDRATELKAAGNRPSAFAEITIAADENGKITAWDSHHWGTNGLKGGTVSPTVMPYVVIPKNRRVRATGITTHLGGDRAWRAPNHPQACALTCTAIDDLAAALDKDPYEVLMSNLDLTARPQVYAEEMKIAGELMGWQEKWKGRGKWKEGPLAHGLGVAIHTWGGRAGQAKARIVVNPDGTVETFAGSQDLGTGTRTAIAQVVAECFGIPLSAVKVNIGSSKYPFSGPSGGSTTIGGVSGAHQRQGLRALGKLFDLVAAKYSVPAGELKAAGGSILHGDKKVCSWQDACRLSAPMRLEVETEDPKPVADGLTSEGVGGVQMAHVAVDTETGVTRMVKYVAVQDMGVVINPKLAESQILGAMIQCIAYALFEERIVDELTGKFVNANLREYKLPKLGDIGELVVKIYQPDSEYSRGVVGLGEPPVISGGAAISNAVANAIGKRVPILPLTPKRVLDTLRS